MLRPITVAPMLARDSSTTAVLALTSPPSRPCGARHAASGTTHSCRRSPPIPSGSFTLWLGPGHEPVERHRDPEAQLGHDEDQVPVPGAGGRAWNAASRAPLSSRSSNRSPTILQPPRALEGGAKPLLDVRRVDACHLGPQHLAERDAVSLELVASREPVAAIRARQTPSFPEHEMGFTIRFRRGYGPPRELDRPPIGRFEGARAGR